MYVSEVLSIKLAKEKLTKGSFLVSGNEAAKASKSVIPDSCWKHTCEVVKPGKEQTFQDSRLVLLLNFLGRENIWQ